jgi:hypothetical protein
MMRALLRIPVCLFWVRFRPINRLDSLFPLFYKYCRRSAYLFPLEPTKLMLVIYIVLYPCRFGEVKY